MSWLPITIGITLTLITIATVFVIGVSGADKIADDYTASVKSYLEDVADTISGTANSPESIENDIKDIDEPEIASSIFGNLSSEYKKAKQTKTRASEVVDEATASIKKYAKFNDAKDKIQVAYLELGQGYTSFQTAISGKTIDTATASDWSNIARAIDEIDSSCSDLVEVLDGLDPPKSAESTTKGFKKITEKVCDAVSDMKTSIEDEDLDDFGDAVQIFIDETPNLASTATVFFTTIDRFPSDIKKLSDPVQTLADTL